MGRARTAALGSRPGIPGFLVTHCLGSKAASCVAAVVDWVGEFNAFSSLASILSAININDLSR
jgi:hypothetical protein